MKSACTEPDRRIRNTVHSATGLLSGTEITKIATAGIVTMSIISRYDRTRFVNAATDRAHDLG